MKILIKDLQEVVEKAMKKWPETRDSDYRLYFAICALNDVSLQTLSAQGLLVRMENKELPNWESIGRARRKVQEDNPSLRGNKWDERHGKSDGIKDDLGYPS